MPKLLPEGKHEATILEGWEISTTRWRERHAFKLRIPLRVGEDTVNTYLVGFYPMIRMLKESEKLWIGKEVTIKVTHQEISDRLWANVSMIMGEDFHV